MVDICAKISTVNKLRRKKRLEPKKILGMKIQNRHLI